MLTWSIVYAGILVWVSALAQHFNNLFVHGAKWVASDRSKLIPEDGFTGRSTRALRNNLEIGRHVRPGRVGRSDDERALADRDPDREVVRTTFTLGYWTKINALRSLSWLVGMICIAVLAVSLLR